MNIVNLKFRILLIFWGNLINHNMNQNLLGYKYKKYEK